MTELGLGAADLLLEGPQIKVGQEVSVDYERDGSRKTVRMKARGEDEDEEDEGGDAPAEAPDE